MKNKVETPLISFKETSIELSNGKKLTDKVSFDIYSNEIFALVGESGSGKSITSMLAFAWLPDETASLIEGGVYYKKDSIFDLKPKQLKNIRGKEIGIIFQDPTLALDPLITIKKQLEEVYSLQNEKLNSQRIIDLMTKVGFLDPFRVLNAYPHELSGGMKQRVMIVSALLLSPSLLIADEPTTGVDVTTQKQILDILLEIQKDSEMSILFITHNLALVSQYADQMAIMKNGKIIEQQKVVMGLRNFKKKYCQDLLKASQFILPSES